jgi:hypothetical protein
MQLDSKAKDTTTSLAASANGSFAWGYALVVTVYAVALASVGSSLRHHFGFPLDDSWIHQTVGRNFAWYGSLGYLPHERSSGSTSLLWTLILSCNYSVLPRLSPVVYCLIINILCVLATAAMLFHLALRDGMNRATAILWAAAPAVNGNYLWLTFTGMEHMLFITLSLASILLWLQTDHHPALTASYAGLGMGLLCMTRPEGIVLALILLSLYRACGRTLREASVGAIIAVILAALPFSINLFTSGALIPVTLKGRQWMYFSGNGPNQTYRMQLFEQWVIRPFKAVIAVDGISLSGAQRLSVYGIFLVLLVLSAIALYTLFSQRRWATLLLCTWGVIHSLLYVVILPISGHGGRYQPYLLLLITPLLALGIDSFLRRVAHLSRAHATAVAAFCLVIYGSFSLPLWRSVLAADIDHIQDSHGAMAAFLNGFYPEQKIAVFDIGRIGYDRRGNLIDLGGLVDSSYIPYLYGNRVPQYLREHNVSLVVLPFDGSDSPIGRGLDLVGNPSLLLTPIHVDCTSDATWRLGWVETRHAAQCQQLYEIQFR